jgi:hypothetical protein
VEAITPALFVLGAVNLLMFPILAWLIKRGIGVKLDHMDEKRDAARVEQAEDKRQREAERSMLLAIARTMLLDNYEKCMSKGYYTREEREVYSLLYESYKKDEGNGVIDTIAENIRELPLKPPKGSGA